MTIAKTILSQLGGRKFLAMTGANALAGHPSALSFHFPRAKGVNYCKITLTPMDTYDIEFGSIHKHVYTLRRTIDGVYHDTLQKIFTEITGLATHL